MDTLIGLAIWAVLIFSAVQLVRYLIRRRNPERREAAQAKREAAQAKRIAKAAARHRSGEFSVALTGVRKNYERGSLIYVLRKETGMDKATANAMIVRAAHIEPQPVLEGVSEGDAIRVKSSLERYRAKAKIRRRPATRVGRGHRKPIPEHVRHEVWRRDQGRCVDCGSRERLEFDHIIPLSEGGSNSARNIELRCELHNREKGARI